MRQRDTQKEKLYRAERSVEAEIKSARYPEVEDVQRYVDKLLASAWWRRHFPRVRFIRVGDGRARRRGGASGATIDLPRWTRYEIYIIHEIAHVATTSRYLGQGVAHHGWEYAATFLEIIRYAMGADVEKAFKLAYRKNHVRYKAPRKLAPETLAAMRERGRQMAAGNFRKTESPSTIVEDDLITSFIERLESKG